MTKKFGSKIIIASFGIYFIVPLLMTVLYVFSEEWARSILPKGFTLSWFITTLCDPRFATALGRSFMLGIVTSVIILLIMVPSVVIIFFHFPKIDKWLQAFSLLPFALPSVILATGLLRLYSSMKEMMFWILVGALFTSAFPIMYQSIRNSLLSLQAKILIEAAETLGASPFIVFTRILLPNMQVNLRLSGLLIFSSIFGEFVLTNLLIGGRYETIRIYMLLKMNQNGHIASAVMVIYFMVLFLIAILLNHTGSFIKYFQKKKEI